MADKLWVNGTLLHQVETLVASPGGYGVMGGVEIDFGTPNQETTLDPRSLAPGMRFNGTVTGSRQFRLRFMIVDVGSMAKGQDEWAALLAVMAASNGLVSYKTERTDGTGGTITRELLAIVTGEPAWAYIDTAGADGLRPNGNLIVAFDCVAPFPWWRDFAETTETINFTDTGTGTADIDRDGDFACGAEIKATTSGTLASLTVSDGTNAMAMTATFGASAKGVDWHHDNPVLTSIDSGVVISDLSHFELHSDPTSVTCTPPALSSGNHVVTIKFRNLWRTP